MSFELDLSKSDPPRKSNPLQSLIIILTILLTLTLTVALNITSKPDGKLKSIWQLLSNRNSPAIEDFVYNTNFKYNHYVKGDLTVEKLSMLDTILEHEKATCGLRVVHDNVASMANYDQAVIDGYERWREIYNFRSSTCKGIYPSERVLYSKE